MEYYKKSTKLIILMIGFVLFCAIYANVIQPYLNSVVKKQQEEQLMQIQMQTNMAKAKNNHESEEQASEREFIEKALVEFRNNHPNFSPSEEAQIREVLRNEYRNRFNPNRQPVEINYNQEESSSPDMPSHQYQDRQMPEQYPSQEDDSQY